jgi:hypothetical protein
MTDLNVRSRVEIAGEVYDSHDDPSLFSRLSVELTTGQASEARWQMHDPDFKLIDKYSKAGGVPAAVVRVWLGYGEDLREPVFKGVLACVGRSPYATTLRAYDMGYMMRLVQKTGYHRGSDLSIMRKLVTRNKTPDGKPLRFQGPAKGFPPMTVNSTIHDQRTDWAFLAELASEAGLVLWVRDDTVFAAEPAKVGDVKLSLEVGVDALLTRDFDCQFKLPENLEGRPRVVEYRGRGRGGRRLAGRSDEASRGREIVVVKHDLRRHTKAVAKRRAEAKRELEREHAFQCRVKHVRPLRKGRVDVRDTVELANLGLLFSGRYIVDSVSYEVSPRGFETCYDLYRDVVAQ